MLTHGLAGLRRRALLTLTIGTLGAVAMASCHRAPLLAPTGSSITLVASTNVLPVNGATDILAILNEGVLQGGSGNAGSTVSAGGGTPVHDGTVVSFSTSLGRIEPAEAKTSGGRATVQLVADGRSGTATVTAFSGSTIETLDVSIGAAAAAQITVTANPQSLPGTGGSTTVSARVEDQGGNGLLGVPVSFSTTKGTLAATSVVTNDQGVATTKLTTSQEATVTATAGGGSAALSGTVLVTLSPRTSVAITAPASAVVGVPAGFTITPATGAIITDVVVDFGDGRSVSLGAITGATQVSHAFRRTGGLTVTATATGSDGSTGRSATQIAVSPLPVTLSYSPASSPQVAAVVTFTATTTAGAIIDHYEWDFGDGQSGTSQGNQATHSFLSAGTKVVSVRVVPYDGGTPSVDSTVVTVTP
jgi:hypothetical protein